MGSIIGGVLGGIGSLIGGSKESKANKKAAGQALTGYNYLTSGAGAAPTQSYIDAGQQATDTTSALLGLGGDTDAANNAFNGYKNSTAYNFQLGQGQNAIASSGAAKGLLNSGATAKALTQYGQNLAGTTFNNYLNQLGQLRTSGQNALGQVASAGTAGGANAGQFTSRAGSAQAQGINGALGSFGNAFSKMF